MKNGDPWVAVFALRMLVAHPFAAHRSRRMSLSRSAATDAV